MDLDGIVIHTAHPEFLEINFNIIPKLKFLYDGRNMLPHLNYSKNNFIYLSI
jgi:UDP-N-acetyl-D-mannosaminuronate dehydrogenase